MDRLAVPGIYQNHTFLAHIEAGIAERYKHVERDQLVDRAITDFVEDLFGRGRSSSRSHGTELSGYRLPDTGGHQRRVYALTYNVAYDYIKHPRTRLVKIYEIAIQTK